MSYGIVLVFEGVGSDQYWAVNDRLGIKPDGSGDWPAGMLSHAGGSNGNRVGCDRGLEQQGRPGSLHGLTSRHRAGCGRRAGSEPDHRIGSRQLSHHLTRCPATAFGRRTGEVSRPAGLEDRSQSRTIAVPRLTGERQVGWRDEACGAPRAAARRYDVTAGMRARRSTLRTWS